MAARIPDQRDTGSGSARLDGRRSPVAGAPWLPRGYLPRRVLWSRLNQSTTQALTIVVAPAGAGKTLGVGGWLQHASAGRHAVWLDADRTLGPDRLEAAVAEAGSEAVQRLVVVDDAHQLPAATIRWVNERLAHDPDTLRLVLISRWDLGVSRLVPELLGQLTVIRGDVLRLSHDETARLVAEHARTRSAQICDAIVDRADGWCAAVVLAARAGAAAPDPAEFARRFNAAGPGVADLVAGEVFAALRPR
jgi:LuxR family maltose regulon positive regulatory protein